jgi:Transposase
MTGKRKRYSAAFKAKVAMEALRGELTTSQLAAKYGVHQTMIGDWKRQAMEGLVKRCCTDRRMGRNTPKPICIHAMRTEIGRPNSNIRFKTWTATPTSVVRRPSLCDRSPSPITCL